MFSDKLHRRAIRLTSHWSPMAPRLSILVTYGLLFAAAATPVGAHTADDVEHAKSDRDVAYQNVARVEEQVEAALVEYDRTHTELEDVEAKVDLTQRQLDTYRSYSSDLDAQVRDAIVEAYVSTGSSDISVTLGAETFQDMVVTRYLGERLRGVNGPTSVGCWSCHARSNVCARISKLIAR